MKTIDELAKQTGSKEAAEKIARTIGFVIQNRMAADVHARFLRPMEKLGLVNNVQSENGIRVDFYTKDTVQDRVACRYIGYKAWDWYHKLKEEGFYDIKTL